MRFAEKRTSNEEIHVRQSGRQLYLGGQEAIKAPGRDQIEKRGEKNVKMSSARGPSSEATNTNNEDIVTCMMHLGIACTHVERRSNRFDRAAGKKTLRSSTLAFRLWVGPCICFEPRKLLALLQ